MNMNDITENEILDKEEWNSFILLYNSAIKEVYTKVEVLNDEFQHVHQYNPIEYVKTRIKSQKSIEKKLKRNGYENTIENMMEYINDIAGIRIVCSFTSDIYMIADMVGKQNDITVISVKDYIKNPKPSGKTSNIPSTILSSSLLTLYADPNDVAAPPKKDAKPAPTEASLP